MAAATSRIQAEYDYSQCDKCGVFFKGPEIIINRGVPDLRIRGLISKAIPFPPPVQGYYSNEEGLKITTPSRTHTFNKNGDLHITIVEGKEGIELQFSPRVHDCSNSPQNQRLTREKMLALRQQGETTFRNVAIEDLRWAMSQRLVPVPALNIPLADLCLEEAPPTPPRAISPAVEISDIAIFLDDGAPVA